MAGYIASDFCDILHPAIRFSGMSSHEIGLSDLPDDLAYIDMMATFSYFAEPDTEEGEVITAKLSVDVSTVIVDHRGRILLTDLMNRCEEAAREYCIGRYGVCNWVELDDWEVVDDRLKYERKHSN